MGRSFGTDGARGVANAELTPELAMNIGRAAAMVLISDEVEHPTILIGKDTRLSGDMLEGALIAGLCSVGANVHILGVVPTPAVAYLVGKYNADAGIMISANKLAKKYGEKPVNTKLINIDAAKTIEYAVNKFVNTDDEKLLKLASFIQSKKAVDNTEMVEENVN